MGPPSLCSEFAKEDTETRERLTSPEATVNLHFLLPLGVAVITDTLHFQFYKMVIIIFIKFLKCVRLVKFRKTLKTLVTMTPFLHLAYQP